MSDIGYVIGAVLALIICLIIHIVRQQAQIKEAKKIIKLLIEDLRGLKVIKSYEDIKTAENFIKEE